MPPRKAGSELRILLPEFAARILDAVAEHNFKLLGSEIVLYAPLITLSEGLVADASRWVLVEYGKGYHPTFKALPFELNIHTHPSGCSPSGTDLRFIENHAPVEMIYPSGYHGVACIHCAGRMRCFTRALEGAPPLRTLLVESEEAAIHIDDARYAAFMGVARGFAGGGPAPRLRIIGVGPLGFDPQDYPRILGAMAKTGSREVVVEKVHSCRYLGRGVLRCTTSTYAVRLASRSPPIPGTLKARLLEVPAVFGVDEGLERYLWDRYLQRRKNSYL
jgi:hypothetical protein